MRKFCVQDANVIQTEILQCHKKHFFFVSLSLAINFHLKSSFAWKGLLLVSTNSEWKELSFSVSIRDKSLSLSLSLSRSGPTLPPPLKRASVVQRRPLFSSLNTTWHIFVFFPRSGRERKTRPFIIYSKCVFETLGIGIGVGAFESSSSQTPANLCVTNRH